MSTDAKILNKVSAKPHSATHDKDHAPPSRGPRGSLWPRPALVLSAQRRDDPVLPGHTLGHRHTTVPTLSTQSPRTRTGRQRLGQTQDTRGQAAGGREPLPGGREVAGKQDSSTLRSHVPDRCSRVSADPPHAQNICSTANLFKIPSGRSRLLQQARGPTGHGAPSGAGPVGSEGGRMSRWQNEPAGSLTVAFRVHGE